MPRRPARRCPDCKRLHDGRAHRCDDCRRDRDRQRGTTSERGYGAEHQALRDQWRPYVEAGYVDCRAVICLMPDRRILPGQPWDLDHDDDRTGYRGPAHERCNRATTTAAG